MDSGSPASPATELALFDLSGWLLATATIASWAAGGVVLVSLPDDKVRSVPAGREVRFQCTLPAGEVRGLAEVSSVDLARGQLGLRLLQIDNEQGLPSLLDFVYAQLRGD